MVFTPTNATGWTELLNGKLIDASFKVYNTALMGWTAFILFFVFQFMLYTKSRSLPLTWVTGIMFMSLYGATLFTDTYSLYITYLILTIELGGILYLTFMK